jgi:hypothetical protein
MAIVTSNPAGDIETRFAMFRDGSPVTRALSIASLSGLETGRLLHLFLRCEATTAFNQISHAVRELDYFSLSLDVEIDCEITRGSPINRLF